MKVSNQYSLCFIFLALGISIGFMLSTWNYAQGYSEGQEFVMKNIEYICSNRFERIMIP
jgi:hypothetical protein